MNQADAPESLGSLESPLEARPLSSARGASTLYRVGAFVLDVQGQNLRIYHERAPERALFQSPLRGGFLWAGRGRARVEESRGFFRVEDHAASFSRCVMSPGVEKEGELLRIVGQVDERTARWFMEFRAVDEEQLAFSIEVENSNRIELRFAAAPDEKIFGFGEQFTVLNMKGRCVPVLSQEPGIGRGVQPLTFLMEKLFQAGGSWHHSNAPAPHFLSTSLQSIFLEEHAYSTFDFTNPDETRVAIFQGKMRGRILYGRKPSELIEVYTRYAGRMPALPDWMGQGAVIGMQGGAGAVEEMWQKLQQAKAAVSAFWLQDWVGGRTTSIGKQLWWNWESDVSRYPNWPQFVADMRARDVRVLGYINPFLVDPSEKGDVRRNLFQEAIAHGYVVKKASGEPYWILNTSFSSVLIDLTNPAARQWLKGVLREQLLATGVSGWMADFGEALPFDAVLFDGSDAATYHNRYPEEWAKLNREVVEEEGRLRDVVFFARSGFTQSPRHATLFWLGDQLTSWTQEDGIKSALVGLLSSGFSGFSLNHSDIGGYTATTMPKVPFRLPLIGFVRSKELLGRWIEMNAFTAVFRTHEGNQPDRHHQIDGDAETLAHFARFSRIFAALHDYRRRLFIEAERTGLPVVRHPWLHFPNDATAAEVELQFMLGPDFMIAPVLEAKREQVAVYLPAGQWVHLWSQQKFGQDGQGQWVTVPAPMGFPGVFYRASSKVGAQLYDRLVARNDLHAPAFANEAAHK